MSDTSKASVVASEYPRANLSSVFFPPREHCLLPLHVLLVPLRSYRYHFLSSSHHPNDNARPADVSKLPQAAAQTYQ